MAQESHHAYDHLKTTRDATAVLAYGQTGSGKTHSMFGGLEEEGMIPHALRYLYLALSTRGVKARLKTTFYEIFNERVMDLLNPNSTSLPVRYNKGAREFYVEGAFVVDVPTVDDVMQVLKLGQEHRATAAHELNERSSRSHALLTVYIEQGRDNMRPGKLTFVDLAGSERVTRTKTSGKSLQETLNINRSLLTLGTCISAMAKASRTKNYHRHVPFRDSKLTKVLMDHLSGWRGAKTLMIACVSPASSCSSESIQTLRYALRVKEIRSQPIQFRLDRKTELVLQLKKQVEELKLQNEMLQTALEAQQIQARMDVEGTGEAGSSWYHSHGNHYHLHQQPYQWMPRLVITRQRYDPFPADSGVFRSLIPAPARTKSSNWSSMDSNSLLSQSRKTSMSTAPTQRLPDGPFALGAAKPANKALPPPQLDLPLLEPLALEETLTGGTQGSKPRPQSQQEPNYPSILDEQPPQSTAFGTDLFSSLKDHLHLELSVLDDELASMRRDPES